MHGTQDCEDEIPFSKVERTDNGFTGTSATGVSSVAYAFEEDRIQIKVKTDKDCGPRVGVQMNLNLLDMPTRLSWVNQCMPKVIYTDDEFGYAYFIFATADGRFLGLTVNGEFAAWRIQYSYDGHKMTGFQILMQADDVICASFCGQSIADANIFRSTVGMYGKGSGPAGSRNRNARNIGRPSGK